MLASLKTASILLSLFCFITLLQVTAVFCYQSNKTNIAQLRKLFTEAVGQDFEIVKDILDTRPVARGGETYWLVHVKPKRSGHFALKYIYQYPHKLEYPEEGENELFIRVGGKNCSRYNNDNLGLGNVCLGDTVIVPIRIDGITGHQFTLKSDYRDAESIGQTKQNLALSDSYSSVEQINNPLEASLKYLGTQRSVMPHRNYGAETIVYTAFFEAKSAGRFNLGISSNFSDESAGKSINMDPLDALPVIIINPGTPVTTLVYHEDTVNYADHKKFSGHAGHDFLTRLLILQPGDVFEVQYSSRVNRWGFGEDSKEKSDKIKEPKLIIQKLPFMVNKDWSYNEWLINYLPPEK